MKKPLITVCTPILNGNKYLDICINSVLGQSYPHIEHLFIDGGSVDGTLETLSKYKKMHPDRIRFISEPDSGGGEAWNKGLKIGKGEIFCFLGADDLYLPHTIEIVLDYFRSNPDAKFVYGDCHYIDEEGNFLYSFNTKEFSIDYAINIDDPISATSAFFKRDVIDKVGFLDETMHAADLDYWVRIGRNFQLSRISSLLSYHRLHTGGMSGSNSVKIFKVHAHERFMINRKYNGNVFSPYVIRYIISLLVPSNILIVIVRPTWKYLKGLIK